MSVPLRLTTRKIFCRDGQRRVSAGLISRQSARHSEQGQYVRRHSDRSRPRLFVAMLMVVGSIASAADTDSAQQVPAIHGYWINPKNTVIVRVEPCDKQLCGAITWLAKPYRKNGELKRVGDTPWCNLNIVQGFSADDDNRWSGGTVYDPSDDKTYKGTMTLVNDDTLHIRGYVLFRFLGRTMIWRRVAAPSEPCPLQ